MKEEEAGQSMCYKYFKGEYPQYSMLLFHPMNEGIFTFNRSREAKVQAMYKVQKNKAIGVVSGVADLILLVPNGTFPFAAIELKIAPNKPTSNQEQFRMQVEQAGGKHIYIIAKDRFDMKRSFIDFIKRYMKEKSVTEQAREFELNTEQLKKFLNE